MNQEQLNRVFDDVLSPMNLSGSDAAHVREGVRRLWETWYGQPLTQSVLRETDDPVEASRRLDLYLAVPTAFLRVVEQLYTNASKKE